MMRDGEDTDDWRSLKEGMPRLLVCCINSFSAVLMRYSQKKMKRRGVSYICHFLVAGDVHNDSNEKKPT